jgi:hypothetical protein
MSFEQYLEQCRCRMHQAAVHAGHSKARSQSKLRRFVELHPIAGWETLYRTLIGGRRSRWADNS